MLIIASSLQSVLLLLGVSISFIACSAILSICLFNSIVSLMKSSSIFLIISSGSIVLNFVSFVMRGLNYRF